MRLRGCESISRAWSYVACSLVLSFVIPFAQATTVDPDIARFEKAQEAKIQTEMKDFFGNDFKALVTVTAKKSAKAESQASAMLDIGYLSVPLTGDNPLATQTLDPTLQIDSLDVALGLPKDITDAGLEAAKALAQHMLKAYKTNVTVERMPSPGAPPPLPKSVETLGDKLGKPEVLGHLISILGAALIMAFGIGALAWGLQAAAKAIAEGFTQIRTSTVTTSKNAQGKEQPAAPSVNVNDELAKQAKSPDVPPVVISASDHARNMKLVKQVLKTVPVLFLQAYQESPRELDGLKKLLPNLEEDEQQALKAALGDERLARLSAVADDSALNQAGQHDSNTEHNLKTKVLAAATAAHDFSAWLQDFVERIMVAKVQGGSHIEKVIGPAKTLRFFTTNPALLIRLAGEHGSRAIWRIAAEFAPPEYLEQQLAKLSDDQWKTIMDAGEVSSEEILAAANELCAALDQNPEENSGVELRERFYANTLLNPVIGVALSKSMKSVDAFIDRLAQDSPGFSELLRENLWTPKALNRLSDDSLGKLLKTTTTETKVSLIVAMPSEYSERIDRLIPQGNVKVIVTDLVRKARSKNDPKEQEAFEAACRRFLEQLRVLTYEGKLQLVADSQGGAQVISLGNSATDTSPKAA